MTGSDKLSIIKDKSINPGSRDLLMFCPNSVIAEEEHAMQYGVHRIDYSGDIIYENIKPVPNRILFDGGYITFSNKQPVYHFYLTDHQGNVRVVASVDPLAEKYPDISPYVYCHDNPVNAIDPDGRYTMLYARQLNRFLPMDYGVHTFIVVYTLGKVPQYFSYGPSGRYTGTLKQTYYEDDINIYTNIDKGLDYVAIKITPPHGINEEEFDKNVIKAANDFYEHSEFRYNILSPHESQTSGNCNSSSSTVLHKAGLSRNDLDKLKDKIPGFVYGFGDIKPWTKQEREDVLNQK